MLGIKNVSVRSTPAIDKSTINSTEKGPKSKKDKTRKSKNIFINSVHQA